MTRTAHRIGLAAVVVALAAAVGAGTTAAYAQSGTGAVTSSISLSFSGGTRISRRRPGEPVRLPELLRRLAGERPHRPRDAHESRPHPNRDRRPDDEPRPGRLQLRGLPAHARQLHLHRHLRRRRSAKLRVGDVGRPDRGRRRNRARPRGLGDEERLSPSRHPDGAPGEARRERGRVDLPASRRRRPDARSFRSRGCRRQRRRSRCGPARRRRSTRCMRATTCSGRPPARGSPWPCACGSPAACRGSTRQAAPTASTTTARAASRAAPAARGTRWRWRPATPGTRSG